MTPDFTPGVASMQAAGIKVKRAPYPTGPDGARLSLETIAQRIREGASDSDVKRVAFNVLEQAGFHGRGDAAGSYRQRAAALLAFVREWLLYVPDQPGAENVPSAAAMLCLRENLCVRMDDCDGNLVLLGSMVGGTGINVRIVKQNYGPTHQEHVLLEAQDESGAWFYLDPSTNLPPGEAPRAVSEVRVDPMDQAVGDVGTGAELITMGRPPGGGFHHGGGGGRPIHHRFHDGQWWAHWPDYGWLVVEGASCNQWSDPIAAPSDVHAEAARQLAASHNAPVSEEYGGRLYLFTFENGAVVIRTCVNSVGYGAAPVGVGFCDYDLIKSVRARLIAPWMQLRVDITENCPGLSVDQKSAFNDDYLSFMNWYSGALPDDWFCKDAERAEIEQGRDFESRLNNWRRLIVAQNCQPTAPELPPLTPDDPRSRDYKPPEGGTLDTVKSLLITAGIVGAVGVGVYITMPLLRAGIESLTEKTKAATRKRATAK